MAEWKCTVYGWIYDKEKEGKNLRSFLTITDALSVEFQNQHSRR